MYEDALNYSKQNSIPIIINKINLPSRFEKINGLDAKNVWCNLFYSLSLKGLNLLGAKAAQVRIKEDEIVVSTENARVIKFVYDEILVFDNENVVGLPTPKKENQDFIVYDWMVARSCETHPYEIINTEDLFVNKVPILSST